MWAIFYTGEGFAEMELAAEKSITDYRIAASTIANCFGWLYIDIQYSALTDVQWAELYDMQASTHSLWRSTVLGEAD